MSERKFKVGDRVVGVGTPEGVNIDGLTGKVIVVSHSIYDYGIQFDKSSSEFHSCGCSGKDGYCRWVDEKYLKPLKDETIVIYRKDNQVIAHNKATGKKGVAKCNPEDTFDFNIGAKLAFERLMSTKRIVKQDKYEVGDKVKVRDDLKTGYMYTMTNYYKHNNVVSDMMRFKGKVVTIKSVDGQYRIEECGYSWTDEMFEGKVIEDSDVKEEPKKLYNGKVVCIDNVGNQNAYTVGKIYEFKDGKLKTDNGVVCPLFTPIYTFGDWLRWTSSKFIEVVE